MAFLFEMLAELASALGLRPPERHARVIWITLVAILLGLFAIGVWRFGLSEGPAR